MDRKNQYLHLDYLRLFRLCKSIGLIKRNRKIPLKYKSPISAHKRLFSEFIKEIFKDYVVSIRPYETRITFPKEIQDLFKRIDNKRNVYFKNNRNIETIYNSFFVSGFVASYLPYEIKIYLSPSNSRWAILSRTINSVPSRPKEEFYRAATFCIEYKKILDSSLSVLKEHCDKVDIEEEERKKKEQEEKMARRQAEKIRLMKQKELTQQQEEELKKMATELEKKLEGQKEQKIQKLSKAQEAFNKALEQMKGEI